MWVVKLGGSLYDSPQLPRWLEVLAFAEPPVVIVPGGGPFADQVRAAQQRWRIDDRSAHVMALSAMDQFGVLCCGIEPRLCAAAYPDPLAQICAAGKTAVWLPSASSPPVERSWRVTSDSLAAWLAMELRADALVLVKSTRALNASDLVDESFAEFRNKLCIPVWALHRDEVSRWRTLSKEVSGAMPEITGGKPCRQHFQVAGQDTAEAAEGLRRI